MDGTKSVAIVTGQVPMRSRSWEPRITRSIHVCTRIAVILGVLSVNLTLPDQLRVARDTFIEMASRL
jgi:hypothetical protein